MTMADPFSVPLSPSEMPALPLGYFIAEVMDSQGSKAGQDAIHDGCLEYVEEVMVTLETMQGAMDLKDNKDEAGRLRAFYNKPDTWEEGLEREWLKVYPEMLFDPMVAQQLYEQGQFPAANSWESYKAYFPRRWQKRHEDFQRLRIKAAQGLVGKTPEERAEMQRLEMEYSAFEPEMQPA